MKTVTIGNIWITSAGHGHNTISISAIEEGTYSTTTSNTRLTDRIKGADRGEEETQQAIIEAIELVLSDNGIEHGEILTSYNRDGYNWDVSDWSEPESEE